MTAVVRSAGTPLEWDSGLPDDPAERRRLLRPGFPIRSVHATGFRRGCVRPVGYSLMISDPNELEPAVRAVGEWMVREDRAGEIDIVVSAIPQLQ